MEEKKNAAIEKVKEIEKRIEEKRLGLKESEDAASKLRVDIAREKAQDIKDEQKIKSDTEILKEENRQKKLKQKAIKKLQKQAQNSNKKFAKAEQKEDKKERKAIARADRLRNGGGKKQGGLVALTVVLALAVTVLGSALAINTIMPTKEDKKLSKTYEQTFYDTVEQTDSLDLNLSKFLASNSKQGQKYLTDVAVNAELLSKDLSLLPLNDNERYYSVKLVNQVGDYAKYLNKKLLRGEEVTEEEYKTLSSLHQNVVELKKTLNEIKEEFGDEFDYSKLGENDNIMAEKLSELQNLSAEYPELIYDGPFSDGLDDKVVKGLSYNEVSKEKAEELLKEYLSDYDLSDVNFDGTTDGIIKTYDFSAKTKDGFDIYASLTLLGGKLLMFDYKNDCKETKYSVDDCVEISTQFLNKIGLDSMRDVWAAESTGIVTVNFVYYANDLIYYPDMVKVQVCPDTGLVVGLEASHYYLNHTDRKFEEPTLSKEEAAKNISANMDIFASRLAVIPLDGEKETLCYEFAGIINGETFYSYINAKNGNQEQLFKVVKGTEGMLLM